MSAAGRGAAAVPNSITQPAASLFRCELPSQSIHCHSRTAGLFTISVGALACCVAMSNAPQRLFKAERAMYQE
jgi:hypothetical protein